MYIGMTCKDLNKRLNQHINKSLRDSDRYTKKENWIRKRISENYKIEIILLEDDLSREEAIELEVAYISKYKLSNLTNLTTGGEGVSGYIYSKEQKLNWYNSIKVYQYDLNGNFIKEWESGKEAQTTLGISNIARACTKGTTAGGFRWKRKNDESA